MEEDSFRRVAEFYSGAARFPLADIAPGDTLVCGSDARYPGVGGSVLYVASYYGNRCVVSTQHELVSEMQRTADTMTPSQLMANETRQQLVEICYRRLGEDVVCYRYSGVKLYCDRSTYLPIADENVRRITRTNAGEAMTCLLDDGIPTDVDYLLGDDAAFAYYFDDRPVAFAGTHPVGDMSDRIGNVMVGTHRDHRGRGYGKAVVSATTGSLLSKGRVAVYGTSEDNVASQKTALSVGYQMFADVFEVRFANA